MGLGSDANGKELERIKSFFRRRRLDNLFIPTIHSFHSFLWITRCSWNSFLSLFLTHSSLIHSNWTENRQSSFSFFIFIISFCFHTQSSFLLLSFILSWCWLPLIVSFQHRIRFHATSCHVKETSQHLFCTSFTCICWYIYSFVSAGSSLLSQKLERNKWHQDRQA